MPEKDNKLTVRIRMKPAEPGARSTDRGYRYRWGRIALVATGLVLLAWGLLTVLAPEPPEPPALASATAPAVPATPLREGQRETAAPAPSVPAVDEAAPPAPEPASAEPAPAITAAAAPAESGPADESVADASTIDESAADEGAVDEGAASASPAAPQPAARASIAPASAGPVLSPGDTRILSDKVARFLLSKGMRGSEPLGRLEDVKIDDPASGTLGVFAFSDVRGMAGETLVYRWLQGERVVARVRVGVGSDKWRSHSSKVINGRMRGPWRVELTTGDGTLLAFAEFAY
jgi:Protein of unknown function (DUF2914)